MTNNPEFQFFYAMPFADLYAWRINYLSTLDITWLAKLKNEKFPNSR